jgi:Tfp pilus assembly PilM family ATPase
MRNLDQFLANELGIPVVVADPMTNLTVHCPKYTPQYLREVSPLFPVSIGLAIREMLE